MPGLRRTPLHDRQEALGARFVPFGGWELPVQFSSITDEHRAVRAAAGVFDVSHMGQLEVRGDGGHAYLQARLSNDLDRIDAGQAQYTLLMHESGGIVDDLIAYRQADDDYLLVVNAANVDADAAALPEAANVSDEWAMLAVQGPAAPAAIDVEIEPFTWRAAPVLGVECLIAGTGYTGEPGCELLCAPGDVGQLWDAILEQGVVPCGLGARDTLRLEMAYPLHGQDITLETDPFSAGLGWAVRTAKEFVGVERLRRVEQEGPERRLVGFEMTERAIPRPGMEVRGGGMVTSGGYSPSLERGIGLGYVAASEAEPGTQLVVDVRGKDRPATVVTKPIYKRQEEQS